MKNRSIKRHQRVTHWFLLNLCWILTCMLLLHCYLPSSSIVIVESNVESPIFPLKDFLPFDHFDLFWTIWSDDRSAFRGRHFLVIDSVLLHHPDATVIVFSSTLDDETFFLPYRQRGYRIYSSNISINETKTFVLHFYGGTFFPMDSIFLQPLPRKEFLHRLIRIRPGRMSLNGSCFECDLLDLPSERFSPFSPLNVSSIFDEVRFDTSLKLADLIKRYYSIMFFSKLTKEKSIAEGSLIDLLFDLYDLRYRRLKSVRPVSHRPIYIDLKRKRGRFLGYDLIYFRTNDYQRWNLTLTVTNGTLFVTRRSSLTFLNQAEINRIFHQMFYRPWRNTSIDTLEIELKNGNQSIRCSLKILVFHRWVSILTKTMGTNNRWPILNRLIDSVEKYFSGTSLHIASDSGQAVSLRQSSTVFIHNLPEDVGLSASRNYLVNRTETEFFFLIDDDFIFEDDSHLDLLLEMAFLRPSMDIIAGKIPEDVRTFEDYSGLFLLYNETLELRHDYLSQTLIGPCRSVHFVPNSFLGRTKIVGEIRWDDELKLAEHEDFFLRFHRANRIVVTCRFIHVHHYQEIWWRNIRSVYYGKRARVYDFYQKMLIKHRLKRIITFGMVNLDLDQLKNSNVFSN